MFLLQDVLLSSLHLDPNKKAVICRDKSLSYKELNDFSDQFASSLVNLGIRSLDRVTICLENSIEAIIAIIGVLKASGIFILVSPLASFNTLNFILTDSESSVFISEFYVIDKHIDNLSQLSPKNVICVDRERHSCRHKVFNHSFWNLISNSNQEYSPKKCINIDVCSIIYTSGSTGKPKGVALTHLNILSALQSITAYLENTSADVILNFIPLSFDYGLYQALMSISIGGTLVLEPKFLYPYQLIGLLNKESVTALPLVPGIIAILLEYRNLKKYSFPSLRYITSTAQALPPQHLLRLSDLFPHARIYSMYGLTECKRVSFLPPEQVRVRPSSVGKAIPNTQVYLIDEHSNLISAPNKVGELVVRGSHVMKEYWNSPLETAKVLKKFSWCRDYLLLTGDLFWLDDEGFLYFVGRKDDLVKVSGEKVWPKEVESILYLLEDVLEVLVFGVSDRITGQAIHASVVLRNGSNLNAKDLIQHCGYHLEKCKIPRTINICQSLPKTINGKLAKNNRLLKSDTLSE